MSTVPLFEGFEPAIGTFPMAVDLSNDGPDASGVVKITGQAFNMTYPVELPRGARKRISAYPLIEWSGLQVELQTNQGRISKNVPMSGSQSDSQVNFLDITDSAGELGFLRAKVAQNSPRDKATFRDTYTRPQDAPGRAVAYEKMSAVVLGPGSERISGAAVEALKLYALSGGTLIFLGGASSPILADPRWASVLPIQSVEPKTIHRSDYLEQFGALGAFTVLDPKVALGAAVVRDNDRNIVSVSRGVGLGQAVYLPFNIVEPPFNRWAGSRNAFLRLAKPMEALRARSLLAVYGSGQPSDETVRVNTLNLQQDPFSLTLPSTEEIAMILVAYFVCVVPINFLVLKKLKRGELAWLTAPIISLVFAGVLLRSASGLYTAQTSTATKGVLLLSPAIEEGLFAGNSQVFIPQGGGYDLKLRNVDNIGQIAFNDETKFGDSQGELDAVDVGTEVLVPSMPANNLTFRQLTYRQRYGQSSWFDVQQSMRPNGQVRVAVTNRSPYDLVNATVFVGSSRVEIPLLRPGEMKEPVLTFEHEPEQNQSEGDLAAVAGRNRQVLLYGYLAGSRPGPQLGKQIRERTSVAMIYAAPYEGATP